MCSSTSASARLRLETRAAVAGCLRGLRVGFEVPLVLVGGSAQDAVVGAGNYVGDAFGVLFVEDETRQAGVADANDLAPYRLHGGVAHEVARSEPRAVDDHAGLPGHLVERGEGALLHVPPEAAKRSIRYER